MYTSFFGFKSKPFQLIPDPEYLFLSRIHKKALMYLNYGISSDSGGFILITGGVGTGKTTVIRSMIKGLKEDVNFSRITNTRVTSEQLLTMINEDFGLTVRGKDKTQMLRDLTDFLIEQYGKGNRSFLIIDEAQNLTPDLLEEIRLLSNLETDKAKLLQIVLVGQSELREVLARPELRALRQRINVSCHIYPLTREETEKYIFHRLEIAGNREAVSFEEGGIDVIYNFSRGIPRLINIACDFLLVCAFTEETKEITVEMVKEVIDDLERENRYWQDEIHVNYSEDNGFHNGISKEQENTKNSPLGKHSNTIKDNEILKNVFKTNKLPTSDENWLKTDLIHKATIDLDKKLKDIEKEIREIRSRFPKELKEITSEIKKEK